MSKTSPTQSNYNIDESNASDIISNTSPSTFRMQPHDSICKLIKRTWPSLTKSDRKVARSLLSVYPLAGLETLAELADRSSVSAPSVIRCIKRLGFDGYPSFQKALHHELQRKLQSDDQETTDANSKAKKPIGTVKQTVDIFQQGIAQTYDNVQIAELITAATLLCDTRRKVLCSANASSIVLANFFQSGAHRIRPNIELISQTPTAKAEALIDLGKKHILVIFDFPHYDTQMHSFAKLAKEKQSTIILFTDREMSPINHLADCVITSCVRSSALLNSVVPAVSVLEVLLNKLIQMLGAPALRRIKEMDSVSSGIYIDWEKLNNIEGQQVQNDGLYVLI